jgi:hypothetical protein
MTEIVAARCAAHRDALLDFLNGRDTDDGLGEALDHLARCADCEREVELNAMAIVGLRRLSEEVATIEPRSDAWVRLRTRVDPPPARTWSVSSPIAGTFVALSLVAVLGMRLVANSTLPAVIAPATITIQDAFEPKVVRASLSDGDSASSASRRAPDGDGLAGLFDGSGKRGRLVSHA